MKTENETLNEELLEAERRRQEKAARTNTDKPPKEPGEFVERLINIKPVPDAVFEQRQREREANARRERYNALVARASIPPRHLLRHNNGLMPGGEWGKTLTRLKSKLGTGLIGALLGTRGTGKTQIAVELMLESMKQDRTALYATAMDLFLDIKRTFKPEAKQTEDEVVDRFCKVDFLALDELQERGDTAWCDRILTHIIDKRYREGNKDTLLMANLDREAFDVSMGRSVVSRLNETGGTVVCDWESFRERNV